jgi:type I restriction enzyme M protein
MKREEHLSDLFSDYEVDVPKLAIQKRNLEAVNNLKIIFREIRDYFAGNVTGITRDEAAAQTLMRLLFCKVYDELTCADEDIVEVARRPNDTLDTFSTRIALLFEKVKKKV